MSVSLSKTHCIQDFISFSVGKLLVFNLENTNFPSTVTSNAPVRGYLEFDSIFASGIISFIMLDARSNRG